MITSWLKRAKDDLALIQHSRFFDPEWYLRQNPDVQEAHADPALHFLRVGGFEGRDPGPRFQCLWYLSAYPEARASGLNPLVHYLRVGRQKGYRPAPNALPSLAAVLLALLSVLRYQPAAVPRLFLQGIRHWLRFGPQVAYQQAIRSLLARKGKIEGRLVDTTQAKATETALSQGYGETPPVPCTTPELAQHQWPQSVVSLPPAVRAIAFYLPQYYPIPENDKWWGKGFTEWHNVVRAKPLFPGHRQPRLPGELGFYDLRVPEVQERQVELARNAGVFGFCFYFYWFQGKRLLEKPLDQFAANPHISYPFCICWANEPWTRRWDGLDSEVLMPLQHTLDNDLAVFNELAKYMNHPNYIRIDDRPLLLVYRAHHLSDPPRVAEAWRELAERKGLPNPFLVACETVGSPANPETLGFDAMCEFPPHAPIGLPELPERSALFRRFNPHFAGTAVFYQDLVNYYLNCRPPCRWLFRSCTPGFDNTPRRRERATVFWEASPELFGEWLEAICQQTLKGQPADRRVVFIASWNEWGEGSYLEPDDHFGYAFLHAAARVLKRGPIPSADALDK